MAFGNLSAFKKVGLACSLLTLLKYTCISQYLNYLYLHYCKVGTRYGIVRPDCGTAVYQTDIVARFSEYKYKVVVVLSENTRS